jgi:hypothetical protein
VPAPSTTNTERPVEADRAEHAVGGPDRLVDVGQQREGEAVGAGEGLVALDPLRADAEDLRPTPSNSLRSSL